MGDFGKVDVSRYAFSRAQDVVAQYEAEVSEWLATGPGSFSSRDGGHPYRTAHDRFTRWSTHKIDNRNAEDDFEIALARLGFRAGIIAYNGDPLWLLVLPSKATEQRRVPTPDKHTKKPDLDGALAALLDGSDDMDAGELDKALAALAERELA